MSARHTTCRHCGQYIEGLSPYRRGEWRDRGNNSHCPDDSGKVHAPVRPGRRHPAIAADERRAQSGFGALETMRILAGLTHAVQVMAPGTKSRAARWETIAAFNVERVALAYAQGAIASHSRPRGQLYRVIRWTGSA